MDKYLIKNTTRAQREEIVKKSLGYCDIGCDDSVNGYDMYEPYINGEKELSEIAEAYKPVYVSEALEDFRRDTCNK